MPTDERHPALNLSYAVTLLLYEIFLTGCRKETSTTAVASEKEKPNEKYARLPDSISHPVRKKKKTALMFRRLVGRFDLSRWEFFIMMGVLSGSIQAAENEKRKQDTFRAHIRRGS